MQKTPRINQPSRKTGWALSKDAATGKSLCPTAQRAFASGSFAKALLGCAFLLTGTLAARATVYSFTPDLQNVGTNVDKMDNLDHLKAYVWQLNGIRDVEYVSAKLTITNINNWDLKQNALFIHLFNTDAEVSGSIALPGGSTSSTISMQGQATTITSSVRYYADNTADNVFADFFNPTGANDLYLDTYVDDYTSNGTSSGAHNSGTIPTNNWYDSSTGISRPETYVLQFNAAQLAKLNDFIGPQTGTIAFGFDPDCHYFNSGITFELCDISPVPEASTFLPLVGVLLLAGGTKRFRKDFASKVPVAA